MIKVFHAKRRIVFGLLIIGIILINASYRVGKAESVEPLPPEGSYISQVEAYLNNNYDILETPLGTLNMHYEITYDDSTAMPYPPYDFRIYIRYGSYVSSFFYCIHQDNNRGPYDDPILDQKEKEETISLVEKHAKQVYDVVHGVYPDKLIQGSYYDGWWRYPTLRMNLVMRNDFTFRNSRKEGWTSQYVGFLFISRTDFFSSCIFKIDRISGQNRYQTAVEISKDGWDNSDTVIIVRGDEYADALTGAPLAYQYDAPILLTRSDRLNSDTEQEIVRLNANKVIILGGTGAVSKEVEDYLNNMGYTVERIGGDNRFETAKMIAEKMVEKGVEPEKAIIVYGFNFPDALAIAPYASQMGYPILLTRTNTLPTETTAALQSLDINNTIVMGGTAVISNSVANELPGSSRISGSDRYATAAEVIRKLDLPTWNSVFVATGENFPDALTGSVLAAKRGAHFILVRQNSVPTNTKSIIDERKMKYYVLLGGEGAISTHAEEGLKW